MNIVKEYFKKRFRVKPSSKDWFRFTCPHCGKPDKAAVHFLYYAVKCWTCSYRLQLFVFLAELDGITANEARDNVYNFKVVENFNLDLNLVSLSKNQPREFSLPYSYTNILDQRPGHIGLMARNYMEGRGLDLEYLDSIGVGYCYESPPLEDGMTEADRLNQDFKGYIISPYIAEGKLVYYTGRTYMGGFPVHKFPPKGLFNVSKSELIFNEDAKYNDTVIVVESVFCAETLGPICMAFGGKDYSQKQLGKLLEAPCENIVVCLDAGTEKESYTLGATLINYDKKVKVLDLGYFKELGYGKDPNEIGKERIMQFIKETPVLTYKQCFEVLYGNQESNNNKAGSIFM